VLGVDSSTEMIAASRAAFPEGEWEIGRIEDWAPTDRCDVVFSNAALQWTRDHAALVRRLFEAVAPGGALAFQIPSGIYSPVRTFMQEVADDAAWADRMGDARHAVTMEEPSVYYDALAPAAHDVDLWETEYHHVLASPSAIVDWMSSTGLRPYLAALASDEERGRFVSMLTDRVASHYSRRADGRVLFPFRRLFVVAYA
jgi:trans-aconitate 2-methyltransferase